MAEIITFPGGITFKDGWQRGEDESYIGYAAKATYGGEEIILVGACQVTLQKAFWRLFPSKPLNWEQVTTVRVMEQK